MKRKIKTIIAVMLMSVIGVGCGAGNSTTGNSAAGESAAGGNGNAEVSGTITMNGSTSMEKFATALNESFMIAYPNITSTVEFTGSGAGIEAVSNGTVDIGNSSRNLKEEEKAKGLVENIVAIDGIGIVVDNENSIEDISKDNLAKIYKGEISNWKEIGGTDENIVVIGREASSGTRSAFEEILKVEDACNYAQEIDSTGAVMAKVASTPGAIGYVSLDVIDDTVKCVTLDGVEATPEKIKAGEYFLCRPFVMATKGEISEQTPAVKALFDYIDSEEGQAIIEKVGLISAK